MISLINSPGKCLSFIEQKDSLVSVPFIVDLKVYENSKLIGKINEHSFSHLERKSENGNTIDTFLNQEYGIYIYRYLEEILGSYRTYLKIENKGDNFIRVLKLSSLRLTSIFENENDDINLYSIKSNWCSEGELIKETINNFYIPLVNGRDSTIRRSIQSFTNNTTSTYVPLIYIESENECAYVSIEPYGRWEFEFIYDIDPIEKEKCLCVSTLTGCEKTSDFYVDLYKNSTYETIKTVFAKAKNKDEAQKLLYDYKREKDSIKSRTPIVYNDYLNSLWGVQNDKDTIALIDKASYIGADIYTMDSGWYKMVGERDWFGTLGDWNENDALFGNYTLSALIDYAKAKNLKYGLWFEFEVVTADSIIYKEKGDEWLLKLNGEPIYECGRYFLDFRKEEVKEYLINKIGRLYEKGIRYIKNDFNTSLKGIDTENGGTVLGLEEHQKEVVNFYKALKERFKDLVIENCASGQMRADDNFVRESSIQSFSDSEKAENYPKIIAGSLLHIVPEKLGVWTTIYPKYYEYKDDPSYFNESYKKERKDLEETMFAIANAFMGTMYISGRIDEADIENLNLLKQAIQVYKMEQDFIRNSIPVYPSKTYSYFVKDGVMALGLRNNDEMILSVFNLSGKNTFEYSCKECVELFDMKEKIVNHQNNRLTINFNKDLQARILKIKI